MVIWYLRSFLYATKNNNASLPVCKELSLFTNREANIRTCTRIFLARTYYIIMLANKIIRTTKDIGSYFSDVMDVCQHATSYGIQHSQRKFTKKNPIKQRDGQNIIYSL